MLYLLFSSPKGLRLFLPVTVDINVQIFNNPSIWIHNMAEESVADLLETALKEADDDDLEYHIRQALQQLVVVEKSEEWMFYNQ